eukprot:7823523-Pyramimonas_sp.AAC.2
MPGLQPKTLHPLLTPLHTPQWGGLLGPSRPFDTNKYFIVCANVLGSCYGTTGPTSTDPATKLPYGGNFPYVTVRDSVRLHAQMIEPGQ